MLALAVLGPECDTILRRLQLPLQPSSLLSTIFSSMATFSPDWAPVVPPVKVILPRWPFDPHEALTLPVPSLAGVPTTYGHYL